MVSEEISCAYERAHMCTSYSTILYIRRESVASKSKKTSFFIIQFNRDRLPAAQRNTTIFHVIDA